MSARARPAAFGIAFVATLAAGCAQLPTPPSEFSLFGDDVAPLIIEMTPLEGVPPLEPIEPVEPPLIAPPLMPAPTPAPALPAPGPGVPATGEPRPAATTAAPPPATLPTAATGVPAENVVAAAATSSLPQMAILPPDDLAALNLLADLQRYNAIGPDEVKRELATATSALQRERTDANRVRLAVLYTLSHANTQDDQRALQLLENVAKSGGGATPVKSIAAILYAQVSDRVRAVRDEQVKASDAVQKLEALRAMERSLLRDRVRSGGGGGGGAGGGGGGSSGGR